MRVPEDLQSQSRSTNEPVVVDGQVVGNDPRGWNIAIIPSLRSSYDPRVPVTKDRDGYGEELY